jgi:homoserine kinase
VRGYDEVVGAARQAGAYGATLSGSGPTLVALAPLAQATAVGVAMVRAWRECAVAATAFRIDRPAGGYETD